MSETTTRHFAEEHRGFARQRFENLLSQTGVHINGNNPWDIQVINPSFYRRVVVNGSLGLGESYMDEWWQCDQIDEMINRLMRSNLAYDHKFVSHFFSWTLAKIRNLQKRSRAFQVGEKHYDIGNDLYEAMLDDMMVYTCGYWTDSNNLDDAQVAKLDLVCRKLYLEKGMAVLDIGCGWGGFAKYAAENYGVNVTGITVSSEQRDLARKKCKGLPVEIRLQDYRDVKDKFDAIVSLGMFEHVGHKNFKTYMETTKRCLKDKSRFLLHTIGKNNSHLGVDPWISRYIFPNGEIPSLRQIADSLESLMIIEDVHNFGPDYDKTLMAWFQNFDQAWDRLGNSYSNRFYRMWKYYLHACAGAFRARDLQLWQIVISNGAPQHPYRRPV
jgi:cyclopropane-fatty-acyl-phospholipid synthase